MRPATFHSLTELRFDPAQLPQVKAATRIFLTDLAEPLAGFVSVQVLLAESQDQLLIDITWESRAVFDAFTQLLPGAPAFAGLRQFQPRTLELNAIEI